jgi:hypothetical protein
MRRVLIGAAPLAVVALAVVPQATAQLPVTKPTSTSTGRLPAPSPVVATQLPNGTMDVRWRAIPGAAKYAVIRSVPPTPQQAVANPTDTVYVDPNVQAGSTYYYVVNAVDSAGIGGLKAGSPPVLAKISATASSLTAGGTTTTGGSTGGVSGGTTTGGATLVAPTGIFAEDFTFPDVTIYWGFKQSGMSYRIERGVVPYGAKGATSWQAIALTPPLACCMWSVVDSTGVPPTGSYYVYQVSTVDPAAPSRASAPVVSSQIRVAPVSIWTVTQYGWRLMPPVLSNRTVPVGTSLGTTTSALSSDQSVVSIDSRGLILAKAPGVAYVFTMQLYVDGHPNVNGWRVTVVP